KHVRLRHNRETIVGLVPNNVRLQIANRPLILKESRVVFYEYEKHEGYDDADMNANAELGAIKIRHYHLNNTSLSSYDTLIGEVSYAIGLYSAIRGSEGKEDPDEEAPAAPLAMDVYTDPDYLQFLEELQRHPKYSPFHSSQAVVQYHSDNSSDHHSDSHSLPSFELFGIWPPPSNPSH
ncbi:hypothetical protein PIB30_056064, partial [Stylosanthes scabra]|nr:hypothetical protein [Stylosanthes scabra]